MTLVKNEIELDKTKEAEEINAPEAKMVEALPFQGRGLGSLPNWSTNDFEGLNKNDWRDKCGNDFSIKMVDRQVAGINTSRLSVLKT